MNSGERRRGEVQEQGHDRQQRAAQEQRPAAEAVRRPPDDRPHRERRERERPDRDARADGVGLEDLDGVRRRRGEDDAAGREERQRRRLQEDERPRDEAAAARRAASSAPLGASSSSRSAAAYGSSSWSATAVDRRLGRRRPIGRREAVPQPLHEDRADLRRRTGATGRRRRAIAARGTVLLQRGQQGRHAVARQRGRDQDLGPLRRRPATGRRPCGPRSGPASPGAAPPSAGRRAGRPCSRPRCRPPRAARP